MDVENRLNLTDQSQKSRNKKLIEIMDNRTLFIEKIDTAKVDFAKAKPFEENCENAVLDGNDISVCVRIRPLLDFEEKIQYFPTIFDNHPQVHAFEPRFGVKGDAKVIKNDYTVDFAFGPQHSNDDIYDCVAGPVVHMGLQGGVSTIFGNEYLLTFTFTNWFHFIIELFSAYGQTASGKTFT